MLNVNIDKVTNMIAQPDVWLCHRNYNKICQLSPIADLKVYVTANAVDEVSFTIHKYNNGVEFEYWDKIKDLKVVCVDGFGYFEIAVDKNVSNDTTKVITGISTEAELAQINVDGLEVNGENDKNNDSNFDSSGTYTHTVIYNSSDTEHSLLHRLMSYAPHWTLGAVNNTCPTITVNDEKKSVSEEWRTFSFDGTNVYDALQEIATELDVVFVFNTVTRTVNMYDLNEIGEDTTIFVNTENLATDFTCTSNKDSIKNCFKIVGGDENINVAIRTVNPNGSNYIYYFSPEQMEDMSEGLRAKLTKYEEYSERLKPEYTECCNDLYNAIDDYYNLKTSMMPGKTPDEETDIDKEIAKLTSSKIGNIPVQSLTTLYQTGAEKAILTIAQVMIDYRYDVEIDSGSYDTTAHTWTGKFKVTNTSNPSDTAVSTNDVVLTFVEDEKEYLQDKIDELVKDVSVEDVNIEKFKENLTYYALDSLEQFVNIYAECTKVLEKYSYKDKVEEEFYELYYSYWEKWQACISERDTRKEQVATAEKMVEKYQEHVDTYHEMLDFEYFMGDYYKEFCLYRREDTYQNDNYISDGLDNSNTLQNAQKLVEVATKELIKASLFQTTYTANLNNLFTNPIYKPFYEHFDLFNWIHAEIDGKQIMLRLIGITFDFSAIEKIEVEFSEQVRNANGITDLQSILGQAKSMATSYSSTVKQAASGQEACLEFDTIKQEGLNSALMNIKNSNNEEVVIDNCGINCRSKDQNDQYDQCQLRITGKNIVLTKDDFETASMAIGAGSFNGQECYGVWCDVLCGNFVVSEALLIANSSGTFLVDKDGIIVKRMKLDMSNADGSRRIVIDPELDSILSVYTNSKQVFYVDINGNMCMLGNLYVNNNNMYLKVDMTAKNIIEVGYGEITGTGNEGEAESGVVSGTAMPLYRSMDVSVFDNDFVNYASKLYFQENFILEKDDEIYFLDTYDKVIKKYNKSRGLWGYLTSNPSTTSYEQIFVKSNRNDNNLYICSKTSSGLFELNRFNLDDNTWYNICELSVSLSLNGFHDAFLDGNVLYISYSISGSGSGNQYLKSYILNGIEENQGTIDCNKDIKQNDIINKFIPYNDTLYAIILAGTNYCGVLVEITNLEELSFKTITSLDNIKTTYSNRGQYCFTIMDEKIYVFCTYVTDSNKYFVYDIKTKEVLEYDGDAKLECSFPTSNSYGTTGIAVFNDGKRIHLYNVVDTQRNTSYNNYNPTDRAYFAHYIYDETNTVNVSRNFKELDYGKNFRISSQNDYITIDDVIYEIESYYTYRNTTSGIDTNIRKLDTSNPNNDWEIVYTFSTTNEAVRTPIQSNSKDKIYFVTGKSSKSYLCYYDLNTNKVFDYYSGKAMDAEDFTLGSPLVSYESFGYLDATTMTYYTNRQKLTKIDIATNTYTSYSTHVDALSNQLFVDGYFYFVGLDGYLKLYRTSIEDGSTKALCTISDSPYDTSIIKGFSIFHYNNKIQIFNSYYGCGVLSKTRCIYNIADNTLETLYDVFQDLGFYNIDTAGSYQTCFLPMITTSTGVHIFVGYPSFTPYVTNGGYKHYVYTESGSNPVDPDDPDNPSSGDIDNPTDKIFYITNEGDGYFYGTVYAKDGKFSGDIYARSLTLGDGVTLNTSNISGMDDYLKDYIDDSDIITSDNFTYKTETDENGITKVTTTIDGVTSTTYSSSDGNYVLTDVGLGDGSNTYCKISKDGLLTAKNAIIYGQINAGKGYIGGWAINETSISAVNTTNNTGITLNSNGDIFSYGANQWMWLNGGNLYFGVGKQVDFSKAYSFISSNGVYVASNAAINSSANITNYLLMADTNTDQVTISTHTDGKSALRIFNDSNTDISNIDGEASGITLRTDYAGFSNRPLDIITKTGNDDGSQNYIYMNVFGQYEGSGDGSSFDEYGRLTLRSSIKSSTGWIGNDTSLSNGYIPSSLGSTTFRWGQGFFHDLTSTNSAKVTSDRKLKEHIEYLDSDSSLEFIKRLKPAEYTMTFSENKRVHRGFYAQDVSEISHELNCRDLSLYSAYVEKDGVILPYNESEDDENLRWTLTYDEFIAPIVSAIQGLSQKIETLEEEIKVLKGETNAE